MTEQFTNFGITTLNGAITNAATSLIVTSAANFPATPPFRIVVSQVDVNGLLLNPEIMMVTAIAGTTFTVTRAQEGTSAVAHASLEKVAHIFTAALMTALSVGTARSIFGVTGNASATRADIQGTADQVARVNSAGTVLAFGPVNLASSNAVTGLLPSGNVAPPGSTKQVIFNNGGSLDANSGLTYDRSTGQFTIGSTYSDASSLFVNAASGSNPTAVFVSNGIGGILQLKDSTDAFVLAQFGATGALSIGNPTYFDVGNAATFIGVDNAQPTVAILSDAVNPLLSLRDQSNVEFANLTESGFNFQTGVGSFSGLTTLASASFNTSQSAGGDFVISSQHLTNLFRVLASSDSIAEGSNSATSFHDFQPATTSRASIRIPAGTAPTSPNEGEIWEDSTQHAMMGFISGINQAMQSVILTGTASTTVSNSTSELTILGTGIGTRSVPANFFTVGKTVRIKVSGIYSTPLAATPSLLIKVKYGSVILAQVTTTSLLSGASGLLFDGEVTITCRTTGSSGTVMTSGKILYETGVAGTNAVDALNNAGNTATINTTNNASLDVTVQWDTATSTRSVKSLVTTIEVLN